jgi:hypothetical protein
MYVDELISATLRGRDFAQLARDAGDVVTAARLRDIAKPECAWKNHLEPATRIGLARGLGVPIRTLLHAETWSMARYLGIPELAIQEDESRFLALIRPGTGRFRRAQIDAALAVVNAFLDDNAELDQLSRTSEPAAPVPTSSREG